MSLKKKTIRLVSKVLKDPEKRKLYSEDELLYMEKQVVLLREERKRRIKERQQQKGFNNE
jgi:hypothetical protein